MFSDNIIHNAHRSILPNLLSLPKFSKAALFLKHGKCNLGMSQIMKHFQISAELSNFSSLSSNVQIIHKTLGNAL